MVVVVVVVGLGLEPCGPVNITVVLSYHIRDL